MDDTDDELLQYSKAITETLRGAGEEIIGWGSPYHELGINEAKSALLHIVMTSESEDEVRRRIKEELCCSAEPRIQSKKARVGLTMKNGQMIELAIASPHKTETILI